MFTSTGDATCSIILDRFKGLLKRPEWPMVMIFSGVRDPAKHLEKERPSEDWRQLSYLLMPIHFEVISPLVNMIEANEIIYSYATKIGVSFYNLSTIDFI
jgi:hypothetical protein